MAKMKDSGIQWIGEIPEHWECKKTKYCFQNIKEIAGIKSFEYERLALTMKGVIKRSKEANDGLQPENFDTYQIVRKNDIIFKLIDLQNISTSRVGLSNFDGIVSPAYIRIKAIKDINPHYAEKFYNMLWKNNIFNFLGDAGVRSSLNSTDLLNIEIVVPPLEEQNKIANFLDKKCGIIDDSISDIENQIETLEQTKRSMITEAVTKGLDKNAELKDSGAGWMPFIPKHWLVEKLKYNLNFVSIKNCSDREVLSLYRELGVLPKNSRDDNHNVTSEDTSKYKLVKQGNFVVNKMKAWQGSVAVSDFEGIVSPAYYVYEFSNDKFHKKYFHYLLRNRTYTTEFRRLSGGIREGQWDLSQESLGNTLILIPPLQEQKQIADYLDLKCGEIDKIIAGKREEIETLNEYKKSLIFEYVTGKKEVSNE